jgi:hypothetical protein
MGETQAQKFGTNYIVLVQVGAVKLYVAAAFLLNLSMKW